MVRASQTLDGANTDSLYQHPQDLRGLLGADTHSAKEILAGFPKRALALGALESLEALAVLPVGLTLQIAIRQFIVKSPIEIHNQKPDTGVEDSCGFGCANHSPGRCFNTDRGFLLHG